MTAEPASPATPPRAQRRLRVLMVLESEFPVQRGGGSEIQVRTLGEALCRRGHRVTVLTPRIATGPQAPASRHFGLAVARIGYPRVRGFGTLVMLWRLAGFVLRRGRRYDVAHIHIAHYLALVCCLCAPWVGLRTLIKVSGWWEIGRGLMRPDGGLSVRLASVLWRRADAWQAISTRIAAALADLGIRRERILPIVNAVDLARFAPRTGLRTDAPRTYVYVGRLAPEKGVDTLLRGWNEAFHGRSDRRLWLVGSGAAADSLRALAAELGCNDNVEFLGHRDRVDGVLADADIGLLPSLMEGLSNTLLEFMASGLAVLGSRVSGSEDFIRPGETGWLHEPGDARSVADTLTLTDRVDEDTLAAMGRRARAEVERRAGVDRVVDELIAAYAPARAAAHLAPET